MDLRTRREINIISDLEYTFIQHDAMIKRAVSPDPRGRDEYAPWQVNDETRADIGIQRQMDMGESFHDEASTHEDGEKKMPQNGDG